MNLTKTRTGQTFASELMPAARPHGYEIKYSRLHQLLSVRSWSIAHSPALWFRQNTTAGSGTSEVEINRRLYTDEQSVERLPSFDKISQAISEMLAAAA